MGEIAEIRQVGGGCINNGSIICTNSGDSLFYKYNENAPADMFQREYDALRMLAVEKGPRVPTPHLVEPTFILMEDLQPKSPQQEYWENFGRQMAVLHSVKESRFGLNEDNYIGSTPQSNTWMEDGYDFFADQRLIYQAQLSAKRGLLKAKDLDRVETICIRLRQLIPEQPASLVHGDLWSGNATTGPKGEPAIIDPAAHYGWAEADLAMTALFGRFPDAFYSAYQEVRPLDAGWRERFPVYNLYHLLNHLNLFGTGYLGQVQVILNSYT
jgi:fructosamine-3-kinase